MTEAMHLLGKAGGWHAQATLWRLIDAQRISVAPIGEATMTRVATLMESYADLPMDLADATLVALAEERGLTQVFTLDSDFHVYRLPGNRSFDVVPA